MAALPCNILPIFRRKYISLELEYKKFSLNEKY